VRRELFVFGPECPAQSWLLIGYNESVKSKPNKHGIRHEAEASKQESLPDDYRRDGKINRVSHMTIKPTDHKVPSGINGSRRTDSLPNETGK
jgi:hypothetical protein